MADFLNSKNRRASILGKQVTPPLALSGFSPARANTGLDYGLPPYPAIVTGSTSCFWEVVDWPFAADANGFAFDQANLYGIRNLCSRQPITDGGGDKYQQLYPVPRTLPSGYVATERKRFDFNPQSQKQRTATGKTDHKSYTNNWYNYSMIDQAVPSTLSISVGSMTYVPAGGYVGQYAFSLGDQVGFRGAAISILGAVSSSGGPYGGSVTCRIGIDSDPSNPWLYYSTGANPPTIIGSFSGSIGNWPTGIDTSQSFGALVPATLGVRSAFYLIVDGATSASWTIQAKFAYRADIPPFCTVTYQNKIAPGGIIP